MRKEDYDIFVDRFDPQYNIAGDSFLLETYNDDWERVKSTDPYYVWTLVDCGGRLYLIPGMHWVDRMNYVICNNPWKEGQRDYFYA